MKKKLIIIVNPGKLGDENYSPGVFKDAENYKKFFLSPLGGAWDTYEICNTLFRPSVIDVQKEVKELDKLDYSIIVFSGHGSHSEETNSTVIELKEGQEIDTNDFFINAKKRTVILDCCRKVDTQLILEEKYFNAIGGLGIKLDPIKCRLLYEGGISVCNEHIAILNSCSINEYSYDHPERGGYYSTSLIEYCKIWKKITTDNSVWADYIDSLSVVRAHENAKLQVQKILKGKQNPQIIKPRSGPYFPLAVIAN